MDKDKVEQLRRDLALALGYGPVTSQGQRALALLQKHGFAVARPLPLSFAIDRVDYLSLRVRQG